MTLDVSHAAALLGLALRVVALVYVSWVRDRTRNLDAGTEGTS